MPISPEEMQWMRQYASGAPTAELRQQIPSLYNEPTMGEIGDALRGDQRTAQNMSTEPAMSMDPGVSTGPGLQAAPPPAPAPVATDAGGMSGGGPAMSVAPEPTMSTVSPQQLQSMGAEAEARLASSSAPQAAPGPAEPQQAPEQMYMQRYLLGQDRGPGSRTVPGGEQLSGRTVERELHGKLSPETSEELENARLDEQGLAVAAGESAATSLEQTAAQQRKQAQSAHLELSKYDRNLATKQTEYDIRQSDLDDLRADIQKNPTTFWTGKDAGQQVVSAIGLAMLGILGGPKLVMQANDRDIAVTQKDQDRSMSLLQDRLNRFEKGLPSPESAQAFRRSLAMDAAASEAEGMADMAKSDEARQRGYQMAEHLRIEALKARAAGETGLVGKEKIETKNMPSKVVGGGKGRIEQIIERGKKAGMTSEQALTYAVRGQLPTDAGGAPKTEHDLALLKDKQGRSVEVPGANLTLYAPRTDDAKDIQTNLRAQQNLTDSLSRIRSMVETPGRKVDQATWKKVQAEVAQNILTVAKAGGQGAVGDAEADRLGVLGGDIAKNWTTPDSVSIETLEHVQQMMNVTKANTLGTLYSDPYSGARFSGASGGKRNGITETELK